MSSSLEYRDALRVVMMPRDTNKYGTIFGGVILSYVDQAAFIILDAPLLPVLPLAVGKLAQRIVLARHLLGGTCNGRAAQVKTALFLHRQPAGVIAVDDLANGQVDPAQTAEPVQSGIIVIQDGADRL